MNRILFTSSSHQRIAREHQADKPQCVLTRIRRQNRSSSELERQPPTLTWSPVARRASERNALGVAQVMLGV